MTEQMQIGPWGWLGWVLATLIGLLYYRLWTGASASEMRRSRL
jgi:hypothetical protein